jgi:ubiquinone/menaquinone biosynthesis C-methylase UbiE
VISNLTGHYWTKVNKMDQWQQQKIQQDLTYSAGARAHVTSDNPLVQYIVRWRLWEALRRATKAAHGRISSQSRVLILCAGEGLEGTVFCDSGYKDVTVSDISEVGVAEALKRDARLKGLVLNAECANLERNSFDIVIVQDGLHHLQNPVLGFTEMLRMATTAAIFLEPHDSLVGRTIGTKWEKNGQAINYVFRWTKKLVEDVASSYLGPDSFQNLSFSFWHHNMVYHRLGKALGEGTFGLNAVRAIKYSLDIPLAWAGNQFCGLILKR